jgi:alkylation response protein AidB-like acyl-CoA dehydrogenase
MAQAGSASANVTDEQFAVRDMVRSWAAASKSIDAVRAVEQEDPDAWRAPYRGLAQLGTFGVAIPEELGGAGGSVEDLCLMVDEAAAALVSCCSLRASRCWWSTRSPTASPSRR